MGLDMFLLKAKKITEADKKKIRSLRMLNAIQDADYTYVAEKDSELIESLIENGCACKEKAVSLLIDIERIKEDFGIPKEAHQARSVYFNGMRKYVFAWESRAAHVQKAVSLNKEEVDKYTYEKEETFYFFKTKEADYWRKYYDLQDLIYSMFDDKIKSGGLYVLSDYELAKIYQFIQDEANNRKKYRPPNYNNEKELLVYHEC